MKKSYVYPENGKRSDEYFKKLKVIESLGIDPFSKEFLSDERFDAKEILDETEHWFVFENQHKYEDVKHQFVFVSQQYAESFIELPAGAANDLFMLVEKICKVFSIDGGGLSLRFGDPKKSGATVLHLHAQLTVPHDNKSVAIWLGSKE